MLSKCELLRSAPQKPETTQAHGTIPVCLPANLRNELPQEAFADNSDRKYSRWTAAASAAGGRSAASEKES